jgi:hypothetical protein
MDVAQERIYMDLLSALAFRNLTLVLPPLVAGWTLSDTS